MATELKKLSSIMRTLVFVYKSKKRYRVTLNSFASSVSSRNPNLGDTSTIDFSSLFLSSLMS